MARCCPDVSRYEMPEDAATIVIDKSPAFSRLKITRRIAKQTSGVVRGSVRRELPRGFVYENCVRSANVVAFTLKSRRKRDGLASDANHYANDIHGGNRNFASWLIDERYSNAVRNTLNCRYAFVSVVAESISRRFVVNNVLDGL